jgi:hypothetical protein
MKNVKPLKTLLIEIGIGYRTCRRILTTEFGMHGVTPKFVPRILTADHEQQHVNICDEVRQIASDTTFFRVITGGKSWILRL